MTIVRTYLRPFDDTRILLDSRNFGAKANGNRVWGAVASSASTTVTAANGQFTATDVGKIAVVYTESAAGTITTIAAVNSATSITLTVAAGITTNSTTGYLIYGSDDSAAIQAALDRAATYVSTENPTQPNHPIGTGRATVTLASAQPDSLYLIASAINVPSGVEIDGSAALANVLPNRNAYCVTVAPFAGVARLEIECLFGTGVACGTAGQQAHIYLNDIRIWHCEGAAGVTNLTGSTSTSGGTLTANTRYYTVTAIDSTGAESKVSNEFPLTSTGSTSSNSLSWDAYPGAVSYRIYRTLIPGLATFYFTSATNSYLDTGGASTSGSPIGAGVGLRLRGYHYEIGTAWVKIARLGIYHEAGSDCAVKAAYTVGCVTGVRCNGTNQLRYASLFLDTCGGTGSLGGLILDNGCSNSSFYVQAFSVVGTSTTISPVVNFGPINTTKQVAIAVELAAAGTGGVGVSLANSADIRVSQTLTTTSFASLGGAAITTGVAYGTGLTGEIDVATVASSGITASTGTRVGSHQYRQGGNLVLAASLQHTGSTLGFYGATPTTKLAVTGSRGGNAAVASLLTQLATLGLITDSSSA